MSESIQPPDSILYFDRYMEMFLHEFELQCGGRSLFDEMDVPFDRYVTSRAMSDDRYRRVLRHQATAEEAVGVFREFIAGGLRCPDGTAAAWADSIGRQIRMSTDPRKVYYVNLFNDRMSYPTNPSKTYSIWIEAVTFFMGFAGELKTAVEKFLAERIPSDATMNIAWDAANQIDVFLGKLKEHITTVRRSRLTQSLEWAIISEQFAGFNNFMNTVVSLKSALEPDSVENRFLDDFPRIFMRSFYELHDPFDRLRTVVLAYIQRTKSPVEIEMPPEPPKLKSGNPPLLWELIDRVVIIAHNAAKRSNSNVKIAFSWDPVQHYFVMSMPPIDSALWPFIDNLVRRMDGYRGITSNGIEIRIPMRDTQSTPPPPAGENDAQNTRPGAGNDSGGSFVFAPRNDAAEIGFAGQDHDIGFANHERSWSTYVGASSASIAGAGATLSAYSGFDPLFFASRLIISRGALRTANVTR